jgi:Flp pilus assembly protein CpaB
MIHETTVLQRNLVPGFVTDPKALADLYVTRPLFTNEQLTLDSFGKASARGVQGQLTGTDRAIAIKGSPQQLLAGTLRAGDHVDVTATWSIGSSGSSDIRVSRIILRDIIVLHAPAAGAKATVTSGPNNEATAQLKLSDTEARQLFWMMENGEWSLVLRSPLQAANGKDSYDDSVQLLKPALPPGLRAAINHYEATLADRLGAAK